MATNFAAVTNNAGVGIGTIKSSSKSTLAGWIICDGKTVGKVGSGADFEGDLYRKLYDELWNLGGLSIVAGHPFVISSAKGGSEQIDWDANKTIEIDFATNQVFVRQKTSGRNLGSFEDHDTAPNGMTAAVGSHTHSDSLSTASDSHYHEIRSRTVTGAGGNNYIGGVDVTGVTDQITSGGGATVTDNHSHTVNGSVGATSGASNGAVSGGGSETRPINVAMNFFIKY